MGFDAIGLRFAHLIGSATARTGTLRINVGIEIICPKKKSNGYASVSMSFDAIALGFAHLIGSATVRTGKLRINVGIEIINDFRFKRLCFCVNEF